MDLPKVKTKSKKRRGQGYGSGKGGHTTGRGQKGQKTRAKIGIMFEGVKVKKSLIKRLPFKRGKDKFKSKPGPIIISVEILNIFPSGSKVDLKSLVDKKIVKEQDAKRFGVKVLGNGKLTVKKLNILIPTSKKVAETVNKLGGNVSIENSSESSQKTSKKK